MKILSMPLFLQVWFLKLLNVSVEKNKTKLTKGLHQKTYFKLLLFFVKNFKHDFFSKNQSKWWKESRHCQYFIYCFVMNVCFLLKTTKVFKHWLFNFFWPLRPTTLVIPFDILQKLFFVFFFFFYYVCPFYYILLWPQLFAFFVISVQWTLKNI